MMQKDNAIRPCGASWAYCDGNCAGCTEKDFTTSNSTDEFRMPTEEEYTHSSKLMKDLSSWIRACRKKQDELIDELCKERAVEKSWQELYESHKEIVRKYEILQEIAGERQDD